MNYYRVRIAFFWGGVLLSILLVACGSDPTPLPLAAPTLTLIPASATPPPTPTSNVRPTAAAFNPSQLPTHTPVIQVDLLPPSVGDIVDAVLDDRGQFVTSTADDPLRVLNVKQVDIAAIDGQPGCLIHADEQRSTTTTGFRVVVSTSQQAWVYHALDPNVIRYCPDADLLTNEGTPLLFDPISESLVENARSHLANRLNIEGRTIEWVDLVALTWPDTSLGCPVEDGNYTLRPIEGYRIVLTADGEPYIYHADGIEIRPCPIEQEQLPPPFITPPDIDTDGTLDFPTPAIFATP